VSAARPRERRSASGLFDVIVIGVGGMGSAAVYHLARRGRRVLGLEQFDIPHDLGSSHGLTRIIRLAYAEGAQYVPLLRRSYELWRELEHVSGERLLFVTGGIDAGGATGATIRGVLKSCRRYELPYETLTSSALHARYPGYRFPHGIVSVYQPESGFLLPERCIVAHVEAAQRLGAAVHARERVVEWKPDGARFVVTTDRGVYRSRKLVLTAGSWAGALVPQLRNAAVPERQVLLWTQPRVPEHFQLGRFPIFNLEAAEGRFYGFPVHGGPGFKIGKYHHLNESVDPDRVNRMCTQIDEAQMRVAIRRYFPDADGPTMAMKTCLFTNTPDEHFILDGHPDYPGRVAIAAGFSGHGFKFCSVVGEIMADLVVDGRSPLDLRSFRLSRPRLRRRLSPSWRVRQ
jgi:sarcosine oxidase